MPLPELSKTTKTGGSSSAKLKEAGKPVETLPCPRCESMNTKFCYYNNYSVTQPRHFCRQCQRYWTAGGTLRNVPVGGGSRKKNRGPRIEPYQHPHRMHMMPGAMPGGYLPQFMTPDMQVPHYGMMMYPAAAAAVSPVVPLQTRPATPGLTFELNLHNTTGADSQSNNLVVPSPAVKTASPPHGSSTIEEEGSTPTNGYSTSGYEEGDAVSSMWHEMHDMDNILFQ